MLSAFGELRTAEIHPESGWSTQYGLNSRLLQTTVVGTGLVIPSANGILVLTQATGDEAKLMSRRISRYVPGTGGICRIAPYWTGSKWEDTSAECHGYIGAGNDEDGFFFGIKDSVFGICVRRGGVDTFTPYTSFNIDNKMDGTGPSGIDFRVGPGLNYTKGTPMQIQWQWLGFGQVTFSIENQKTGAFEPVHTLDYASTSSGTTILNPQLNAYGEVVSTDNNGTGSCLLFTASAMVGTEGKTDVEWYATQWAEGNVKNHGAGESVVMSLRNDTTFLGDTNRIPVLITDIGIGGTVATGSPRAVTLRAYRADSATMAAAIAVEIFAAVDADSCCSLDTAAGTITTTGLDKVWEARIHIPSSHPYVPFFPNIDLVPGETITFTAQLTSGTGNSDTDVSLRWIEQN
jgi:hypothetical protein